MVGLAHKMASLTPLDTSDLLRSSWALAISALDAYVHHSIHFHLAMLMSGNYVAVACRSIEIPVETISSLAMLNDPVKRELIALETAKSALARRTFQSPEDIADAFRLVGIEGVWLQVAGDSESAGKYKRRLSLMVRRRNTIVHESDLDGSGTMTMNEIDGSDVTEVVDFVGHVCTRLDSVRLGKLARRQSIGE